MCTGSDASCGQTWCLRRRSAKVGLPVITFNDRLVYHINGEEITTYHVPPAHTDGDSFVRFRNANVVHTGDVFASGRYPFIDSTNVGKVAAYAERGTR